MNLESVNTPADLMKANEAVTAPNPEQMDEILLAIMKENGPEALNAVIQLICHRLLAVHNGMAEEAVEAGEIEAAGAWFRDGGKYQSIMNVLDTIEF